MFITQLGTPHLAYVSPSAFGTWFIPWRLHLPVGGEASPRRARCWGLIHRHSTSSLPEQVVQVPGESKRCWAMVNFSAVIEKMAIQTKLQKAQSRQGEKSRGWLKSTSASSQFSLMWLLLPRSHQPWDQWWLEWESQRFLDLSSTSFPSWAPGPRSCRGLLTTHGMTEVWGRRGN